MVPEDSLFTDKNFVLALERDFIASTSRIFPSNKRNSYNSKLFVERRRH
jgi:hypothetical protein